MSARNITVSGRPILAVRGVETAIAATARGRGGGPAARVVVVLVDALAVTPSTRHRRDLDELRAAGAAVLVVCGAAPDDDACLGAWLRAGADAVLPFTCEEDALADATDALAAGGDALATNRRAQLLDAARRWIDRPQLAAERLERLSPRERRVLDGLVAGHTAGRMADDDVVSVSTIRSQLRAVLRKLDVTSPVAAVALFHDAARRPSDDAEPPDDARARDTPDTGPPGTGVVDLGGSAGGTVAHPAHDGGDARHPDH